MDVHVRSAAAAAASAVGLMRGAVSPALSPQSSRRLISSSVWTSSCGGGLRGIGRSSFAGKGVGEWSLNCCGARGVRQPAVRTARAEVRVDEASVAEVAMAAPTIQQAWVYHEYGGRDVLNFSEAVVPPVAAQQVLVKVAAAALNPLDSKRRGGRLRNSDSEFPTVPCYDFAGVVVKVGSDVTKFSVGDEVYGDVSEFCLDSPKQYGTLAQYTAVEEKLIALKPKNLSFAEAASLPLTLETAYQALKTGGLKEGQTALVLAGSGGVGTLAIQLAKYVFKASVVATTVSSRNVEFVKSLGADVVIDYTKEKLEDLSEKYDVVLDAAGKGEGVKALKEGGSAIVLTGEFTPPAKRYVIVSNGSDLEELNPYFENGTLKPVVDPQGVFEFSDAVKAFEYLERGHATGKVVVSPIT